MTHARVMPSKRMMTSSPFQSCMSVSIATSPDTLLVSRGGLSAEYTFLASGQASTGLKVRAGGQTQFAS
jgi:hypothetical protein